jgi:hypothetical protein
MTENQNQNNSRQIPVSIADMCLSMAGLYDAAIKNLMQANERIKELESALGAKNDPPKV